MQINNRRSEYIKLVEKLIDIEEYEDFMDEQSSKRIHLLTTPGVVSDKTLRDMELEVERFLNLLDLSLNSIPYTSKPASDWMTKFQNDLSFYARNKDTPDFMASVSHLDDIIRNTGVKDSNLQPDTFRHHLDNL